MLPFKKQMKTTTETQPLQVIHCKTSVFVLIIHYVPMSGKFNFFFFFLIWQISDECGKN